MNGRQHIPPRLRDGKTEMTRRRKKTLLQDAYFAIRQDKGIFLRNLLKRNWRQRPTLRSNASARSDPLTQPATRLMTMEVGGLCEVMSCVSEVVPEGAMSFRLEHFERLERFERAPRSNSYIALSFILWFVLLLGMKRKSWGTP